MPNTSACEHLKFTVTVEKRRSKPEVGRSSQSCKQKPRQVSTHRSLEKILYQEVYLGLFSVAVIEYHRLRNS